MVGLSKWPIPCYHHSRMQMTHLGGAGSNSTLGEPVLFPSLHTLARSLQHGLRSLWNDERPSEHHHRLIDLAAGVPSRQKQPLLTPTMSFCGGEACKLGSLITFRTQFRPICFMKWRQRCCIAPIEPPRSPIASEQDSQC
jgi:hypothetical protein